MARVSNIFAEMLNDITKVVRNEHETTADDRQLALNDGNMVAEQKHYTKMEALAWVLSLLECDYPEELYERYGEILEGNDETN